ncbi:MAG TPA: LytTR family DNA-binding domain-containing protein, partial [Phnomibacter sp.]|nr:LytTR family DNA-binding domain-containing protein [Phnomibacter sp.]
METTHTYPLQILILEDEWPVYEHLCSQLRKLLPNCQIYPQIASLKQAEAMLQNPLPVHLLFADIQLQDGTSLELFEKMPVLIPVVYVTSYHQYLLPSLEQNGIDYLLKPVQESALLRVIEKYARLKTFFTNSGSGQQKMIAADTPTYRQRVIIKRGWDYQLLPVQQIMYFITEAKLVFAVDEQQKKYLCDEANLSTLTTQLDPQYFFRANRQYVINVQYVHKFQTDERSR